MTLINYRKRPLQVVGLFLLALTWSNAFAQRTNQPPADNGYKESAILWQQSSGERRALSYQAFALARLMLDRDLRNHRIRQHRAIIVDLDETIIDSSHYQAWLLKERTNYPEGLTAWIDRAEATAVPGAVEFLSYAASRGVRVFYVTNRIPAEKEGTARNLKKLGFPAVDDQSLLASPGPRSASKEPRRNEVSAKYHVVLLMGDDLNDFAKVFEDSKTVESRIAASDRFKNEFGKRFIVLPNPMYGNWDNAIIDYNFKLSETEKAAQRKNQLKSN